MIKYWGVYIDKKEDWLIFVSTDEDEAYSELIDRWFDGYEDCVMKPITKKEYEEFKVEEI